MDTEWRTKASCNSDRVNPDWFFPGDTVTQTKDNYRLAKQVCASCPVVAECKADMDSMYVNGENEAIPLTGLYAGTTPGERSGKNAASKGYEQANKESYAARRRARDKARRRAESPEDRAVRLAKHRAHNQAYELRKKVAV